MVNRDLLKEAIADAKAVKETAIVNAKAALEEAFTPYLKEKLAAKLAEMDEEDEGKEMTETMEKSTDESKKSHAGYGSIDTSVDDWSDDYPKNKSSIAKYGDDETEKMGGGEIDEEMDLDALLRELDEMEEETMEEGKAAYEYEKGKKAGEKEAMNEEEDLINNPQGPTAHGNVAEADEEEEYTDEDADGIEDSEDEEIDIENMDESDLKSFIEGVIADMVAAGELEGGHEGMEGEEEEESEESEEEVEINERKKYGGNKGDVPASKRGDKKDTAEEEGVEDYKKKLKEMKEELDEAYNALTTIKSELQEVNLFNAKLLYTNKIFKAKNLTESQKVKVLAAFDKAASVKEAKLVFETLSEGMKETKKTVNESMLRGSASKPAGVAAKAPILEVNDQFSRWQTLAGIKK
jgi:Arc/MetJ family transcription regulator